MKLYAVGGAVRDHLRGNTGKDLDFAVEAESFEDMMNGLRALGLQSFLTRPEFVTTRGRIPLASLGRFGTLLPAVEVNPLGKSLPLMVAADFTLCRKEAMYHDKRHPSEVTPADIYVDLARRDFTMNAIAIAQDGTVLDPHKGIVDLRDGIIRSVGNPRDRFEEDPLRMLRAIRFAVTLDMWIDGATSEAMNYPSLVGNLAALPVERVQEELAKAMRFNWRETMIQLLIEFPRVGDFIKSYFTGLWFKATTEDK